MADDYVIGAVIGEGLMGPRHAGRYRPSGHPVALEEVPPHLIERSGFVERLALAGRRAAGVTESHVVAVYDLVPVGQRLHVVTELVRGRSLSALLGADRLLPLPAALLTVDSVLAGLEKVHAEGLSHGDVCPEVIVITPAGAVRITELGVAAVLAADPALAAWPEVLPPEGGAPSLAADLYATGTLLRELLSGMRPDEGGEWEGPDRLLHLISRSMAVVPEERFPSAVEFRQELESTAAELLGAGWRVQSDLAARATRPLALQPPRRRIERAVIAAPPTPDLATPGNPPPPPPPPPLAPAPPPAAVPGAGPDGPLSPTPEPPDPFARPPRSLGSGPVPGPAGGWAGGIPPPRGSRRHRGRRLALVLLALLVVVAAAAIAWVVLLQPSKPAPAPAGPLRVGSAVRLTVQPGITGGCNTTFTFTATGSVSGSGTLTYRWVKSTAGSTPVYDQYSVAITPTETTFRFDTSLQLTGAATLDGTVTFQVMSPQARTQTQTIHYACSH
jgi:serine/threonine-protein kinase